MLSQDQTKKRIKKKLMVKKIKVKKKTWRKETVTKSSDYLETVNLAIGEGFLPILMQ